MDTTRGQGTESSFKDLIGIIWRQKWVLVITLAAALSLAVGFMFVIQPMYQSSVRVVLQGRTNSSQMFQDRNDPLAGLAPMPADDVPTQIEQIQSQSILGDALQKVVAADPSLTPKSVEDVSVTARQIGLTNSVEVLVTSPKDILSQQIAAQIPESFKEAVQARSAEKFNQGVNFVGIKLETQQGALTQAEKDLDTFRKLKGLSASPTEASERSAQSLSAEQQLTTAEADFQAAKEAYDSLLAARKLLPARIPNATIQENLTEKQMARQRISDLEAKRQSLLVTYQPTSREVREADAEIRKAREYLTTLPKVLDNQLTVRNPLIDSYDQQIQSAKANMVGAAARVTERTLYFAQMKKRVDEYGAFVADLSRLQRDIELKRASVQQLTTQLNTLNLFINQVSNPVIVIQTPTEAVKSRPNPPLYVAIALFVGTILAGAIALAKDRLDDKVSNLDQAFRITGAPALGYVPPVAKGGRKSTSIDRNTLKALPGRTQENYRIVRSNVLFALKDGKEKSVVVTSTGVGEGSEDVAANLAQALASSGKSTVLIDANLHQPSQHTRFGLPEAPGLSNVLAGASVLADVVVETGIQGLSFISGGASEMASGDLVGSEHMEAILAELAAKYDIIIIAAPSMSPRSDALALSSIADAVVYVVKPGHTNKSTMKYCMDLLRHTRARLVGLVFTDTVFASE